MKSWIMVALVLSLAGCATTGNWLRDVEQPLRSNQPEAALRVLDSRSAARRDPVLYRIQKGMLQRMAGDISGSIESFESAKPLITFQEATSISELAANLVLSEGAEYYQPPAFEQVQLHFFQALNRLQAGDIEGARVEAMQIDILLERRWGGIAPHGGDAAARYLSGVIFEANDEPDNALVAYRKALEAYRRAGTTRIPDDLERRLLYLCRLNGLDAEYDVYARQFGRSAVRGAETLLAARDRSLGELVVVAGMGLVPHRYEKSLLQQDPVSGRIYRIALPDLAPYRTRVGHVALTASEEQARSEPLEDLAAAARNTLGAEMPGLVARAIARNVAKNAAANQVAQEDEVAGLLVNFLAAATETADVRSWSSLPARIHVIRLPMKPGRYSRLEIEYYNGSGGVIARDRLEPLRIGKNRVTVVGLHRPGI